MLGAYIALRDGQTFRWIVPMPDLSDRITFDPDQCDGRACIRGMHVRVVDVLELLAAGDTAEQIVASYPYLEREDILAALRYAAQGFD